MRYILHEIKHILYSKKFVFSILGMIIVSLISLIDEMRMAPDMSVYYLYTVYYYYPMWLVFLVLSTVPGATRFCIDWNNGIYRLKVIRCNKKNYIIATILTCIVSAFLVVVISQICVLLILSVRRPVFLPGDGGALVGGIYEKCLDSRNIWIYFLSRILLQSLGASFFSVLALCISSKVIDVLVVVTAPMIIYYLIENMTVWLKIPFYLSIPQILKGNIEITKGIGHTWLYAGVFWGILIVIFSAIFYRNCKWRIENG